MGQVKHSGCAVCGSTEDRFLFSVPPYSVTKTQRAQALARLQSFAPPAARQKVELPTCSLAMCAVDFKLSNATRFG